VGALRLVRSFLLLEDDYDVDWEVDQDEHPHRRAIRPQHRERRPGTIEARKQVCSVAKPAEHSDRRPRMTTDVDACQPAREHDGIA
jgi:hypothetical protein